MGAASFWDSQTLPSWARPSRSSLRAFSPASFAANSDLKPSPFNFTPRTKIEQFVTVITAKARHSGYTMARLYDGKGETMIKIILSVVAAVFVTIGALTITGAGDDKSGAPTMTTLPVQY